MAAPAFFQKTKSKHWQPPAFIFITTKAITGHPNLFNTTNQAMATPNILFPKHAMAAPSLVLKPSNGSPSLLFQKKQAIAAPQPSFLKTSNGSPHPSFLKAMAAPAFIQKSKEWQPQPLTSSKEWQPPAFFSNKSKQWQPPAFFLKTKATNGTPQHSFLKGKHWQPPAFF